MDTINVVCGLIQKDNKFLITRRKQNKSLGGYWEFPGGKTESGETDIEALKRERKDELGIEIYNLSYFAENTHDYDKFKIQLKAYTCKTDSDPLKLIDHDAFKWSTLSDIVENELAPADRPILNKLRLNY